MNRTYWALALDCNVVVLNTVKYAIQAAWCQLLPEVRFYLVANTISAWYKSPMRIKDEQPVKVTAENHSEIYRLCLQTDEYPTEESYWNTPACGTLLELHLDVYPEGFRLHESFLFGLRDTSQVDFSDVDKVLLEGDGGDWLYRLPDVLRALDDKIARLLELAPLK